MAVKLCLGLQNTRPRPRLLLLTPAKVLQKSLAMSKGILQMSEKESLVRKIMSSNLDEPTADRVKKTL